jgi:hypothetical protein
MQKKPQPPTLKAQIKLHKPSNPIRPVINNINAPTYKIAKHLMTIINHHLHLTNQYNVRNSTVLAEDLTELKINENHKITTQYKGPIRQHTNTRNTQNPKINAPKGK